MTKLNLTELCDQFLRSIRHSCEVGLEINEVSKEGVLVMLPYSERLVGNPESRVIHSGALMTLLDHGCGFAVTCRMYPEVDITPTLDLRIDHLATPHPGKPIYAFCECYKLTSQVAFVRAVAYQDDRGNPIASCVGTFMRLNLNLQSNRSSDQGE